MTYGTVGRLNFRVSESVERRLRSAAAAAHESLTDFILGAAQQRADEVLAARTVVPDGYFDRLLAALDDPPKPSPALAEVARRPRRFVQR